MKKRKCDWFILKKVYGEGTEKSQWWAKKIKRKEICSDISTAEKTWPFEEKNSYCRSDLGLSVWPRNKIPKSPMVKIQNFQDQNSVKVKIKCQDNADLLFDIKWIIQWVYCSRGVNQALYLQVLEWL